MISSIVHIAHQYDDDNNPWPIEIEDHNGKLHSVALEEGQVYILEYNPLIITYITLLYLLI